MLLAKRVSGCGKSKVGAELVAWQFLRARSFSKERVKKPALRHLWSTRLESLEQTQSLAAWFAAEAAPGDCFCLDGAVGVGKSEIVRSALRAMTKMPNLTVRSPTFTIDITYEHAGQKMHHMDLYRLPHYDSAKEEYVSLAICAALQHDICFIEWPQQLGSLWPPKSGMTIYISDTDIEHEEQRDIILFPHGVKWSHLLACKEGEVDQAAGGSGLRKLGADKHPPLWTPLLC